MDALDKILSDTAGKIEEEYSLKVTRISRLKLERLLLRLCMDYAEYRIKFKDKFEK